MAVEQVFLHIQKKNKGGGGGLMVRTHPPELVTSQRTLAYAGLAYAGLLRRRPVGDSVHVLLILQELGEKRL
jgi:hypothetical protein